MSIIWLPLGSIQEMSRTVTIIVIPPISAMLQANFFTYKIAPIWNRLPAEAVNSASVEQFKIELDKVIDTLIWFFFFFF